MAKAAAKTKDTEDAGTALIVIETVKAQEVFVPQGTDKLIAIVEAEVANFTPDVTTEEGRKAISRLDRRIASSKNAIEALKLEYTSDLRQKVTDINAEGKRFFTRMEELQEQVSAPLDKWKADEKARVDAHKDRLAKMTALAAIPHETSADIELSINALNDLHDESYDWQDFDELASAEYDRVMAHLEGLKPVIKKREDDAAELEKLRAAQAERDKKDEEDRLRKEGEAKAAKDAQDKLDEAARVQAQNETDRKNRLRGAIDEMRRQDDFGATVTSAMVEGRIQYLQRVWDGVPDWQEFKDEATKVREDIAGKLATRLETAQAAEKKQRDDEAAKAAQKIKDDEAEAERVREQNKAHRAKINNAALDAMVEHSKVSREDAQAVLIAIAQGKVPNVKISY